MLLITGDFEINELIITLVGVLIGIALLGIAFTGYFLKNLNSYEKWIIGFGSLFFVAPGLKTMIIGSIISFPILIYQYFKRN